MNENSSQLLTDRPLPDACLSDLTLDRLRYAELAPDAAAAAALHLQACERCRTRQQVLSAQNQALAGELPELSGVLAAAQSRDAESAHLARPSDVETPRDVAGVRTQPKVVRVTSLDQARARRKWLTPTLAVLSAAAAIALFLREPQELDGEIRLKGVSGELDVFVKRAGKVFRWQTEALQPGDQLRYSFRAPEPLHVMVLSREVSGSINQYFPAEAKSFAVDMGVTLSKSATQLDATLGGEVLWAVFCQKPFTADGLVAQLQANGAIAPAEGCATQRLEFTKVAP